MQADGIHYIFLILFVTMVSEAKIYATFSNWKIEPRAAIKTHLRKHGLIIYARQHQFIVELTQSPAHEIEWVSGRVCD